MPARTGADPERTVASRPPNSDSSRGPSRGRCVPIAAGAMGIAVLLAVGYGGSWRRFSAFTGVIHSCPDLFCDVTLYYYPMGEAVFRTGLPVDGFLYSPFLAILLAAFPPLGLGPSLVLWAILQILCVLLYLRLFQRLVPAGLRIQVLFVALALSSFPLLFNDLVGQVSVFMVVAILGVLVLNERGHRAAAAGLLALAVSFKFYPILFLAPFALRRDSRFLFFAVAACCTVLLVVPGVLLGFGETMRFYDALLQSFRDSAWVRTNPHSQFFPHLFLRAIDGSGHEAQAWLPLAYGVSWGVAVANMGLIFLIQRAGLRHADLWSFQLVFLTTPFVLKTSWPHDFVFLSFTQAMLAWRLLEGEQAASAGEGAGTPFSPAARPRPRRTLTPILLLLSVVFSNIFFFVLLGDFVAYGLGGFLFWANLFLLIALYAELLRPALPGRDQPTVVA